MRHALLVLLTLLTLTTFTEVKADDEFHQSRARLIINAAKEVKDDLFVKARFVPAPNLLGDITPMVYLGVGASQKLFGFEVVGSLGWSFVLDEPFASVMMGLRYERVVAGLQFDTRFPSLQGYWSANLDYNVIQNWLLLGVEGEGWGTFTKGEWSNGGGPNVLILFGDMRVDLALHARDIGGELKPEFSIRTILNFK